MQIRGLPAAGVGAHINSLDGTVPGPCPARHGDRPR
jgi:hypothetical protein